MEMNISEEPFPHIRMRGKEEMYLSAKATFLKRKDATLDSGRRNNVPVLNNKALHTYLTEVTDNAYKLLYPYLKTEYPKWVPEDKRSRFLYSHNKASSKPFSARDWHLDSGDKLIVGLWYLPHPEDNSGGDLLIRNSESGSEYRIPYKENTLILFPNLTTSWHKVAVRKPSKYDRTFINIVTEQRQDNLLHNYSRQANGTDCLISVKNNYK